jgi:hypothetical protein
MPEPIQDLMDEVAAGSTSSDHAASIRERLKSILNLFRVTRYKAMADGEFLIEGPRSKGARTDGGGGGVGSTARSRTPSASAAAGGVYSVFLKKDSGVPGRAVHPDIYPDTKWVSVKDGTRTPGDFEDRAGKFLLDQNVLFINADFRVFNDMIEYWSRQMGSRSGIFETVQEAVRNWFEQALVETVIGVQALKDSQEWTVSDIEKALSEEALSAAVVQRYHVNNSIKRELGSKLGKIQ